MSNTRKKKAPATVSGADVLARVKPQRRVEKTHVCLRADLIAEFQSEDRKLEEMKAELLGKSNRMHPGTDPDSPEIRTQARKVRKLEEQIEASQVEFAFESRNKDEWAALTADHPPRKDNQFDHMVGYDRDAVLDALVRECMVSPTFEDCTQGTREEPCTHEDCGSWQQLVAVINPAEWRELRDTANLANSGVVDPPKSPLASRILDRRKTASE